MKRLWLSLILLALPLAPSAQNGSLLDPTDTANQNTDLTGGTNPTNGQLFDPTPIAEQKYSSEAPSAMGIPSGLTTVEKAAEAFPELPARDYQPSDVATVQGCGGVGFADYTSAIFNMPEIFEKFQKDVDSQLAKKLLAFNYSMPQTAALFDTLNAYGNMRYQSFRQACSLDALKQDAHRQYLQACIAKVRPEVEKRMGTTSTGTTGSSGDYQAEQKQRQIYSQAFDLCESQYALQTDIVKKVEETRKTASEDFVKTIRAAEDVNAAIAKLMCPAEEAKDCWPLLFLPQVHLCNGIDLAAGCPDLATNYGVKEPRVGLNRYFSLLRQIGSMYVENILNKFMRDASTQVGDSTKLLAATRTPGIIAKMIETEKYPASPEGLVKQFQLDYLNCRNANIAFPLKAYKTALEKEVTGKTFTLADVTTETYKTQAAVLEIGDAADGLAKATESAMGCAANQVVPIFDPNIAAAMDVQCGESDRGAFYSMANYDLALATTRDVYRFLNVRLKNVYARLLSEPTAGVRQPEAASTGTGTTGATTQPSPTDSPELRNRLARVVKEVMIPSIEAQLSRLDEIEKTRGQFAQRVSKIYANRQGCVYNQDERAAAGWTTGGGF